MQALITELNPLLKKWGVEPVPVIEIGPLRSIEGGDTSAITTGQGYDHVTQLAEAVQEEIGAPGQRIYQGQIQTDRNPAYGPMFVRGYSGNPGLYDEVYRTEPLVYDAIRTHTETLVSGTWTIEPPEDPKRTKKAQRQLDDFCKFHNGKLRSLVGGWHKAVEHMSSMLLYGFSVSELVWGIDRGNGMKGRPFIHKIAWRYPATVRQWVMDERQSELLGCHFRVTGSTNLDYMLPAIAPRSAPWERKLLLQSIGGWGNDFEGVAPMRTALVIWKIKQLLIQISALSADTYGIPILALSVDLAGLTASGLTAPTKEDIQKVWNMIKNSTALDAARVLLPAGMRLDTISPTGQMPSFLELIEYLDRMMLVPFSNEGSLLGMTGGGAYALGVVKERETLRTAPYYARLLADPLNEIIRDLAIYELGELDDYPKLVWRMDGMEDASAWSKDALAMIQLPLADWPKPARTVALDKLDLPADTFAEYDAQEEAERKAEEAARAAGMPASPDPSQQDQAAGGGKQAATQDAGESVTGDAPQDGPERPEVE